MKDPHNYKRKLERAIVLLNRSKISKRNKELILKFKNECLLELSPSRILRYLQILRQYGNWLDMDLDKATIDNIRPIIHKLNNSDYSEWTKQMYKIMLKKFYKWLDGNNEEYPTKVKWISTAMKINNQKLPEELLTEDEVKKLIDTANNPRDKALIAILYESGCRIGELLSLKIKNVDFDQYGAKLLVNGKTGPRRVRVIAVASYLTDWINKHPKKDNPDAPLWFSLNNGTEIGYGGIRSNLKKIKKKSGIKKRIYPHLFRHSRATHLANHLTEAQMKEYFGWVQSSDMASVYVHLSGRDVDKALLKIYGIEDNSKEENSKFKPKACIRCSYANPPTNRLCGRCGMVLDEKTAIELIKRETRTKTASSILDELLQDTEFRELFERKMEELNTK